jgi:hypothetical protein
MTRLQFQMIALNCTTFYDVEATSRFLNECSVVDAAALSKNLSITMEEATGTRLRRDILDLSQFFEGDESQDDDNHKATASRTKRQVLGDKEFLPIGIRVRVYNPWKIMESKAIVDQPV